MSIFDAAYDAMSWQEVCSRLPSELAVNALKRRVNNIDTLKMFFDNVGGRIASIKPLKDYVNTIITDTKVDDLLTTFDANYHPVLFNWMDTKNAERFRGADPSKLGLKFLFNLTNSKDQAALENIMDKVLADTEHNPDHIRAVLRKADDSIVAPLLAKISVDTRPEVRVMLLSVPGSNSYKVSELQKIIGLKALAKCSSSPLEAVNVLSLNAFATLRPSERLICLERYLDCFPIYHKMAAFDPSPSEEEVKLLLFAGCIEENEKVTKLLERYNQITVAEPPEKDEEE